MTNKDAQLILWVYNNNSIATDEDIDMAYTLITTVNDILISKMRRIQAINRYAMFNLDELQYTINNSNETIDVIENEIFNKVTPTTLEAEDLRNPIVDKLQVFVDVEKPKTKPKNKARRPKGKKK